MHKFHHHMELPWTDTNFGNVFSFWDRLMGTMVHGDPLQVRYGVDTLEGSPDESIVYQLKVPMHHRAHGPL
jgi:sterol desaturase/sphingolipid hydroxylase (fatty acid hydroxylase superfamily)